jgi:hypothetical protein
MQRRFAVRHFSAFALIAGLLHCCAAEVRAIGHDLPKDYLERHGQLVEGQKPVHGYMVNWEDVFFYAGETDDFSQFAEAYSKLENVELRIVIHAGTTKAISPWGTGDVPADWSYYKWNTGDNAKGGKPAPSRVDVWLGSRIKLEDLRIPANVKVVSGGEIEKFVSEREKH